MQELAHPLTKKLLIKVAQGWSYEHNLPVNLDFLTLLEYIRGDMENINAKFAHYDSKS